MILAWRRAGKIGQCRHLEQKHNPLAVAKGFFCFKNTYFIDENLLKFTFEIVIEICYNLKKG
jgi:hypothetical protein